MKEEHVDCEGVVLKDARLWYLRSDVMLVVSDVFSFSHFLAFFALQVPAAPPALLFALPFAFPFTFPFAFPLPLPALLLALLALLAFPALPPAAAPFPAPAAEH